jgi:hypothetical protein
MDSLEGCLATSARHKAAPSHPRSTLIAALLRFSNTKARATSKDLPIHTITEAKMDMIHSLKQSFTTAGFQDIILLHKSVYKHWVNPCTQYEGPQLDCILEKGIPTFPWLSTINVESVVEFYKKLQKTRSVYMLPIMLFDSVSICMGFKALCPLGLGTPKYAAIARVLLKVLPKFLPKTNTQINTLITLVHMEPNNKFDLI